MKKLFNYLLVVALVLVQFVPVVNAIQGTQTNDGKITISNALEGETYEIYKLFDLQSYDTDKEAYTYTISTDSDWYEFMKTGAGSAYVTLTPSKNNTEVVTWVDGKDAKLFARAALDYAEATDTKIAYDFTQTATIPEGQEKPVVEFNNLPLGFYLVDSSLGTLVGLNTTVKEITIDEKNKPTDVDKSIIENNTPVNKNNANIGDVVDYEVTFVAKEGIINYVLTDTMSNGLDFNNDIVVKAGDTTLEINTHYNITSPQDATFAVVFTESYLKTIESDTTITVNYSATINDEAVINSTGNPNEIDLTYGNNQKHEDKVITYVLGFDLIKSDGDEQLSGAKFKLYREATGGNPLTFTKNGDVYKYDSEGTVTEIEVGSARIEGLDAGTYYLEETQAPDGYNKLVDRIAVTLVDTEVTTGSEEHKTTLNNTNIENVVLYNQDDVTVINTTGTLLPSTGGMGTVLFITIGSFMVLGFGVLLVTKLRLSKMAI